MENRIELTTVINATPEKIWDTLTNPDKIEKYMFGARCDSNWKSGSRADFYVEQGGKTRTLFKGEVIRAEENRFLEYTFLPMAADTADIPENYMVATFEIVPDSEKTHLNITQRGFAYVENGERHYISRVKSWKASLPLLKSTAEAS